MNHQLKAFKVSRNEAIEGQPLDDFIVQRSVFLAAQAIFQTSAQGMKGAFLNL
jgi:hypothetical protein